MPNIIRRFERTFWRAKEGDQARASALSGGYKSGRNSDRGTPEIRSTSKTRKGGTSSHCDTACMDMPSGLAMPLSPPALSIARRSASFRSLMAKNSSMALPESQASLHCEPKAALYTADMSVGKRIARAREDRGVTQAQIAEAFGVSVQTVSQWENDVTWIEPDKIGRLRRILQVTFSWLLEGGDDPVPAAAAREVLLDDLGTHRDWPKRRRAKKDAKSGKKRAHGA